MADVQLSLDVGGVALIVSMKACSASGPSSIFSMVSIGRGCLNLIVIFKTF